MQLVGPKGLVAVLRTQSLNKVDEELLAEGIDLRAEEPEDMWHVHNLILVQDVIIADTMRKVVNESSTGSKTSERVHTKLVISVSDTHFDPQTAQLRVSGKVIRENQFVSLGKYHTITLELNHSFKLIKQPSAWDTIARRTLNEALDQDRSGTIAAVIMHEGLANICLITEHRVVVKEKINVTIPKKRSSAADQSAGMRRFFDTVMATTMRSIDFQQPRPLLLGSPGHLATDFKKHIEADALKRGDKKLLGIARGATVVHTFSGFKHDLAEAIKSPEVSATMKHMRWWKETKYMDEFRKAMSEDENKAIYGKKLVDKAVDAGAIGPGGGTLLISNSLFRSADLAERQHYVKLVNDVVANRGEVRILSSDHESGERLKLLGNIAAILTFPMYDLDEDEDEVQNQPGGAAAKEEEPDMII